MNDRFVTGTLATRTPLHPGTGESGMATELPILRDHTGTPYIPGTQIAGRLREAATRLAPALGWVSCTALEDPASGRTATCTCPVCDLFGSRGQREAAGDEDPAASRLWCFDATPVDGPGRTLIRDGVGISRRTGTSAAEASALYDAEWIPAGTSFALRLELERRPVRPGAPDPEDVLALALSEWEAGRGRLGGGAARGGGAFDLKGLEFRRADLKDGDGLRAFLGTGSKERGAIVEGWLKAATERLRERVRDRAATAAEALPPAATRHFHQIAFRLEFDGEVLINDPVVALAHSVHAAPVHADAGWSKPVLPGSALRGVLRSQVERIARTVAARALGEGDAAARSFARACPACDPFDTRDVEAGAERALRSCAKVQTDAARRDSSGGARASDPLRDAASETAGTCPACALFGSTRAGSRLWIEDAPMEGTPAYHFRDFVAIDRFTGGALDSAKFDGLPLHGAHFGATLLLWDAEPWELAALALALRDVDDGLATVGSGAAKGFGRARVASLTVTTGTVHEAAAAPGDQREGDRLPAATAWSGVFRVQTCQSSAAEWVARARGRGWVASFRDEALKQRREVGATVPWDAWYGPAASGEPAPSELYPLAPNLSAREETHA
ncbi:MAG: hypothetical protein JWM27_1191 [Gemmatimonadetes bacterium]|nr:hypothetical protein [Gemmatimonadota bacterium]